MNLSSKNSVISIILTSLGIVGLIIINLNLAHEYINADGKTQALFGIKELLYIPFKILFSLLFISSMVFIIIAFKKKEPISYILTSIIYFSIGIMSLFTQIWKIFI